MLVFLYFQERKELEAMRLEKAEFEKLNEYVLKSKWKDELKN